MGDCKKHPTWDAWVGIGVCPECYADAEVFARVCNAKVQAYLEQLAVEMARVKELEDLCRIADARFFAYERRIKELEAKDAQEFWPRVKELEQRIKELEERETSLVDKNLVLFARSERAEARVKELEEALRNLLFIFQAAQGKAITAAERVLRGEEG